MRKSIVQTGIKFCQQKNVSKVAPLLVNSCQQQEFSTINNIQQHGGLKDKDRIFTNLYNNFDFHIDEAMKRVRLRYGISHLFIIMIFYDNRVIGTRPRI